jgi:hypothetical protein
VKSSVVVACLSLGVFASGAFAAEYSVKGRIGETIAGSNNYFLSNSPSGSTFKSLTTGNLDFIARTLDTRVLLDANLSFYDYFGSGAADTSSKSGTPGGATFRVDHTTEFNRYNFAATWHRADVATTQLQESGIVTAQGFLDSFSVGGGVTHDLNRTDSIGLSVRGATTTFTGSTQTPYKDVRTVGTWNHQFNPTTALTTSASFDWYDANDPANSQRLFWQIVTALRTQLSSRLSFNGSIGAGFSNASQNNNFVPFNSTTTGQSGTQTSVQAYVGLTYRFLKTTTLSLTAGHNLVPTTYGPLQTISTVGLALSYNINDLSNLSFSTQFARNDLAGVESDYFSARVAYGYRLTRDLGTNLSYTYRLRNNTTGSVSSSTVLLGLNYDFTLLGNPNAHDEKEAENVRQRQMQRAVQTFPDLL